MLHKSTVAVCIAGFLCLQGITSLEFSQDERNEIGRIIAQEAYEPCKHVISEENYQVMLDGSQTDDEEIRNFVVCLFHSRKWFHDGQLDTDLMIADVSKLRAKSLSPPEIVGAKFLCNLCKKEVERYTEEDEKILMFGRCMDDRTLSDF